MKNRNLKVKSLTYMCDLGGIKTTDGRTVKEGLLYRSSVLYDLDKDAIYELNDNYKIQRVFDLRTAEEVEFRQDDIKDIVEYHNYRILSDYDNPVINRKNRFGVFKNIRKEYGRTLHYLSAMYSKMVSDDYAINGFKSCFSDLLEKDVPTIWHCSQGKDRTGIQTFLVLSSLGVDQKTCIEDYLSFNKHCRFKNFWIYVGVCLIKFNPRMAKDLVNLLKAKKQYIHSAINTMNEKYGSVDGFLRQGIGLTDEDFRRLKELYTY